MQHKGTARLETERLILRRFTPDDAEEMYNNWACDGEVTKYLTWQPHKSADATQALLSEWSARYKNDNYYNWGIEIKETGELIGNISVVSMKEYISEAELGWCMGRRWWGQGIMPEAAREVLRYLFSEVGINRIIAGHDVSNLKSGRVMQKIGMMREGTLRQAGLNNTGIVDMVLYSILREEYGASTAE